MLQPISYHTDKGIKAGAVVTRGRKFLTVILVSAPIRIKRVSLSEERYMKPLLKNGSAYPVDALRRSLLAFGARVGITKGAKAALKR